MDESHLAGSLPLSRKHKPPYPYGTIQSLMPPLRLANRLLESLASYQEPRLDKCSSAYRSAAGNCDALCVSVSLCLCVSVSLCRIYPCISESQRKYHHNVRNFSAEGASQTHRYWRSLQTRPHQPVSLIRTANEGQPCLPNWHTAPNVALLKYLHINHLRAHSPRAWHLHLLRSTY
jgi:hypothetical protein